MSGNAVQSAARRRIEQSELDAICARHDRLWQAKPGGARAVLAWLDLSGLSLRGRNLADADFAAANLIGTDLSGARLDNATFFGADMQDSLLVDASLRRTDLRGACLRGADLTTELKRLGEAGYTRVWVSPGELADALAEQGLLTL